MSSRTSRLALLVGLSLWATTSEGRAQGYGLASAPPPLCTCGGRAPHYRIDPGATYIPAGSHAAGGVAGGSYAGRGFGGDGGVSPGAAGPIYGLPRGRRYYGGRFFGSF